jgi:hypothetical protein
MTSGKEKSQQGCRMALQLSLQLVECLTLDDHLSGCSPWVSAPSALQQQQQQQPAAAAGGGGGSTAEDSRSK